MKVEKAEYKRKLELFKEHCKSSREQRQLVSMLQQYGIYLSMKQAVLHEKQDLSWHEDLFPGPFEYRK